MKNLYYIFIIIFFILGCTQEKKSNEIKNDVTEYRLNGKVKSIETNLFDLEIVNDSIIIGQGISNHSLDSYSFKEFNKRGALVFEKTNGSELKYFYDSSNRLTKQTEKYNTEKSPSIIYEYSYNQQDSLIKIIYKNKKFERRMVIERDNENRGIKRTDYVSDTIQVILEVKYDVSGNIVDENTYFNKSKPSKLIKRSFDEKDLLTTEYVQSFRDFDTLSYKNIYKYNDNAQVVEIKSNYINDSDYTEIIKKYNLDGKLIMEQMTPIASINLIVITQKFDENGNIIEYSTESNNNEENDVWINNYKFDKNGNWIEKQKFKNNMPLVIVKRNIEYYN